MDKDILLEKIKRILGDDIDESDVEFALDNAIETVLNYCNIEELPRGLETTVVRMAADLYRGSEFGSSDNSAVQSIKEGDTTTSFGSASAVDSVQTVISRYSAQLNRYRRVVFH